MQNQYQTVNYTHEQLTSITKSLVDWYTHDIPDATGKSGWLMPWHSINDGSALGFIFMVVYYRDKKKHYYRTSQTFDDLNRLLQRIEERKIWETQ